MDHYIPKRRVPVTLWSGDLQGVSGWIFLDLDAAGVRHQTVLEKLNESQPFLPAAVGEEGRIHLFNKSRLVRVSPGRQVIQSDVFTRGFQPWREEEAEVVLADGAVLGGRVWMPLQRETQRLSDFLNQQGQGFFVLLTSTGAHLIHPAGVVELRISESAGAPLAGIEPNG
ncbi:MAG: hypothetical protein HZC42_01840 [Candidatus Eisenbacteria bacterium]|nr:hypothetical protein [Candidatus Eisenbacteria bacterium]